MINATQLIHHLAAGCKRAGISMRSLFRQSGLDRSLIQYWQRGKYQPSESSVRKLRHGLLRSGAELLNTAFTLHRVAGANAQASTSDIRDDLFGMCSLIAYGEKYYELGRHPDAEAVRVRAYELYEQENARQKEAGEC